MAGTRTPLTSLLWKAWGELGASSWTRGIASVIDVEVLIVATVASGDQRLVEQADGWVARHPNLVSARRLRHLAASGEVEVSNAMRGIHTGPDDNDMPWTPALLALQTRMAFGSGARTDTIHAAHPLTRATTLSMTATEFAERTGASRGRTFETLEQLVNSGLLVRRGTQRRRQYSVPPAGGSVFVDAWWRPWREASYAPWHDTLPLTLGLMRAADHLEHGAASVEHQVQATLALREVEPLLARHLPDLARPVPGGPAHTVAAHVRDVVTAASERLASLLANGDRSPDHVDERASAGHSNPWLGSRWSGD